MKFYYDFQDPGVDNTDHQFIDKNKCRRSAFAALGEMKTLLHEEGVTDEDIWTFFKDKYGVTTRKDFTDEQWYTISNTIQASKQDPYSRQQLVEKVKSILPNCKVHRIDSSGNIEIYNGAFTGNIRDRCQDHADLSGFDVQLTLPSREKELFSPNDILF